MMCNKLNADMIKNAARFKITNKFSLNQNDIDPDKQFMWTIAGNGENYYLPDDFNKMHFSIQNFSILQLNARNLNKNIDYLKILLATLEHSFSVIAVCETWAKDNSDIFILQIADYNCVSIARSSRGAGVAL